VLSFSAIDDIPAANSAVKPFSSSPPQAAITDLLFSVLFCSVLSFVILSCYFLLFRLLCSFAAIAADGKLEVALVRLISDTDVEFGFVSYLFILFALTRFFAVNTAYQLHEVAVSMGES